MLPRPDVPRVPVIQQVGDRLDEPGPAFLSIPHAPGGHVDPEVFAAWKQHIIGGFDQNRQMFKDVLAAFMRPYWLTVRMYAVMFAVGIAGFTAAVALGVIKGIGFSVVFGGLSVVPFLMFFLSNPLRSLEQNLHFITWLGVIYNMYWTRLMYANDTATIQADLQTITQTTIDDLANLVRTHADLAGKRPGLPAQDPDPHP